jgi:hypothetical protein
MNGFIVVDYNWANDAKSIKTGPECAELQILQSSGTYINLSSILCTSAVSPIDLNTVGNIMYNF